MGAGSTRAHCPQNSELELPRRKRGSARSLYMRPRDPGRLEPHRCSSCFSRGGANDPLGVGERTMPIAADREFGQLDRSIKAGDDMLTSYARFHLSGAPV